MKNHDPRLLGLYTALIDDVCRYYPGSVPEWKQTQVYLHSIMESRGTKFFTIDLVAAGKHLDRCLSAGQFSRSGLPHQRPRRKRGVIPRLFEGLYLLAFHENGTVRSDADSTAISLLRQLLYAAKKVRYTCDPASVYQTVAEYFSIEQDIDIPSFAWDSDDLGTARVAEHHLRDAIHGAVPSVSAEYSLPFGNLPERRNASVEILPGLYELCQQVADIISTGIGEVTYASLSPHHGPGAVSDQKLGSKYNFPHWPRKLELSFPAIGFALANESLFRGLDEDLWNPIFGLHEPPSKLIAVPKTQKGPRLIASEPISHQWMQQALWTFLQESIKTTFLSKMIDFRDQSHSGKAVLAASARGSGCSIDLSNASDRLSCWLVERFFRSNYSLLSAFHAVRTRWLVNTVDKKHPKFHKLRKFATSGSALTFPVQSIVYSGLALAGVLYVNGVRPASNRRDWAQLRKLCTRWSKSVRVFGDDIIVPEDSASTVIKLLTELGLEVSTTKTFVGGNFYESCGTDAYVGVDVTPTYVLEFPVESKPSSIASAVECSNNLHRRGLWCAAAWLVDQVPRNLRRKLGIWAMDDGRFGLKSFVGMSNPHLKETWNEHYQRWEYSALSIDSKIEKRSTDQGISSLLQYFTEAPPPDLVWESGFNTRRPRQLARVVLQDPWVLPIGPRRLRGAS